MCRGTPGPAQHRRHPAPEREALRRVRLIQQDARVRRFVIDKRCGQLRRQQIVFRNAAPRREDRGPVDARPDGLPERREAKHQNRLIRLRRTTGS